MQRTSCPYTLLRKSLHQSFISFSLKALTRRASPLLTGTFLEVPSTTSDTRSRNGKFPKIKRKTANLASTFSWVAIGLGENRDVSVRSNRKVPLELRMDTLFLKLLLFKETLSAASSSSFAPDLSSDFFFFQNAQDKHNFT